MMDQAARFYQTAVIKNSYNPDALAGLQRAGQWVLNDYLRQFDEFILCNVREALTSTESFVSIPVPSSKFQA